MAEMEEVAVAPALSRQALLMKLMDLPEAAAMLAAEAVARVSVLLIKAIPFKGGAAALAAVVAVAVQTFQVKHLRKEAIPLAVVAVAAADLQMGLMPLAEPIPAISVAGQEEVVLT